jgi:DeoR/GlpR family transcriptional regulator of sugar metabolism
MGKPVSVITNSILLASELMQTEHVILKVIGGDAAGNLSATVGAEALKQIEHCQADKAFIGVNGIHFQEGITGIGYPQMEIKRAMIRRAKETYVLADSSKFGHVYLSHICDIKEVTAILTDNELDNIYKQKVQECQYSVIWGEKEE